MVALLCTGNFLGSGTDFQDTWVACEGKVYTVHPGA